MILRILPGRLNISEAMKTLLIRDEIKLCLHEEVKAWQLEINPKDKKVYRFDFGKDATWFTGIMPSVDTTQ